MTYSLLSKSLFTFAIASMLALSHAAWAGGTAFKSMTKTSGGYTYKLTYPKPLKAGPNALTLMVSQGTGQPVAGLALTAQCSMADNMKSSVSISPLKTGQWQLKSNLNMRGEWYLRLQQKSPKPNQVEFTLNVE